MKKTLPLFICFAAAICGHAQNVGIGTITPTLAKLQIEGSGTQLITNGGPNTAGISQSVPLGLSPTLGFNLYNVNGAFRFIGAGYGSVIQYSPSSGTLYFSTSLIKGNPGEFTTFNPNSVAIDSNGYLGIGTTAPKARLHVANSMIIGTSSTTPALGYILSIDGKVICEELKVQVNTSWPDYVFEDSYELPSLERLEKKVMEEKHLPNIPSAADVKAQQGIEIGDMQKRMLEKMEEMYRYIFQVNNENKALKAKMELLEKRLEKSTL
ncbi:MAG: hypothetical protein V4722_01905 [Bacteroidota bacterium]